MQRITARQQPKSSLTANFAATVLAVFVTILHGCGAARERPLSIKMFNAQTNTTLNCEARDLGMADRIMLADTVESCARQLERNGFVRTDSKP